MISQQDLISELANLDQQRTDKLKALEETSTTLREIDGAMKMIRHLLVKSQKNIEAENDKTAGETDGTGATGSV